MRNLLIILAVFGFSTLAQGQFTLAVKYESNNAADWNSAISSLEGRDVEILNNTISYHLGYWLKPLKEYRWNVIPEIGYTSAEKNIGSTSFNNAYTWTRFDLTINNHIYFMDLESDCNCPTFSKDGNFLSKGFFLNIAPGFTMNKVDHSTGVDTFEGDSASSFKLGVGAGFDIGIRDLLTITPFFNFTRILSSNMEPWRHNDVIGAGGISSNINQREFGLRLNFRFDYVREQRGFRR